MNYLQRSKAEKEINHKLFFIVLCLTPLLSIINEANASETVPLSELQVNIDGTITSNEWNDSLKIVFPSEYGNTTVWVKYDYNYELFLCAYIIPDLSTNPIDSFGWICDTKNDGGTRPLKDDFVLFIHRSIYNYTSTPYVTSHYHTGTGRQFTVYNPESLLEPFGSFNNVVINNDSWFQGEFSSKLDNVLVDNGLTMKFVFFHADYMVDEYEDSHNWCYPEYISNENVENIDLYPEFVFQANTSAPKIQPEPATTSNSTQQDVEPLPEPSEIDFNTSEVEAEFVISNLVINPVSVKVGESISVSVDVDNVGTKSGAYSVELMIDGDLVEEKSVTIDEGLSERIFFIFQTEAEGSYKVEIGDLEGGFMAEKPVPGFPIIALGLGLVIAIRLITQLKQRSSIALPE